MQDQTKDNENDFLQSEMMKLAENFKPVEEVRRLYHHRIIDAALFNHKFFSDRRAVGEYIGFDDLQNLDETISKLKKRTVNPRQKLWGDIQILYFIDETPEQLEEAHLLLQKNPVKDPRILAALPKKPAMLGRHLLLYRSIEEICKDEPDYEVRMNWQAKAADLKISILKLLQWDSWNWFYMGSLLDKEENITENQVISVLIEKIYPKAVNGGCFLLGKHHRRKPSERKTIRNTVDLLLNYDTPLVTTKDSGDFTSRVLFKLAEIDLLKKTSPSGWQETWEINANVSKDTSAGFLWNHLKSIKDNTNDKGTPFKEVLDLFTSPPYGSSTAMLKVVLALFLRHNRQSIIVTHFKKGTVTQKHKLTFQHLTAMLKFPNRWFIKAVPPSLCEDDYLRKMAELFSDGKETEKQNYSAAFAADKAIEWVKSIPPYICCSNDFDSVLKNLLRQLIIFDKLKPEKLVFEILPSAAGFDPSKPLKSDDYNIIIGKVSKLMETVKIKIDETNQKIWETLTKVLSLPQDDKKIREHLYKWLEKIDINRYEKYLAGDSKTLYQIITQTPEEELKTALMEELPHQIGMEKPCRWTRDKTSELKARVEKSVFQMSMMSHLEIKKTKDPQKRMELLNRWFITLFKHLQITPQELETYLENYLEELAE